MKILVIDDHPLIRSALRHALSSLGENIQHFDAADCAEALRLADTEPAMDLVILDLELPGLSGLAALQAVRERFGASPVVVLSATEDRAVVVGALEAGARGFIPKAFGNPVLLGALRLVLSGGVYVPPQALGAFHPGWRARAPARPPAATEDGPTPAQLGLTGRQGQVLALMLTGMSNRAICDQLGLAEGTVKVHVTAILKALGASNRTQAVIAASRLRLRFEAPDDSRGPG